MKELGNLAMICARRPNMLMTLYGGEVSVYVNDADRTVMSCSWDNDTEISRIVHELNFGRYAPQDLGRCGKEG